MAIRDNKITQEVYRLLNSRINAKLNIDHEPTKLYTVNKQVDLINQKKLETLTTESYFFQVQTKGHDLLIKRILKNSLISEMLELKIGAVVMFIKNDTSKRYVNGTTGVIQYFTERDIPVVKTSSGKLIEAEPQIWELDEILVEKDKYTGEVTKTKIEAKVSQIPLKLAWAITIHKSQGMSLDSAEIDLTRSFVEGQGYVALSRLRSFENFTLKGFNTKALEVNLAVKDQDKIFKKLSDDLDSTLKI
jgi:ATP-dependent exoDNAse (exonuclease V) alpha subunit